MLQVPELSDGRIRPGSARLFYAYADALADADREDEARDWFARAAAADPEGLTDAADRLEELDAPVAFDYFPDSDEDDADDARGLSEAEDLSEADDEDDSDDAGGLGEADDEDEAEEPGEVDGPGEADDPENP